jgi:hypothetical protein
MLVTPSPAPIARSVGRSRRYDWSKVRLGEWQNWISPDPDEDPISDAEAFRRFVNLKNSARDWAMRQGLQVQTRRVDHGRTSDLLFTKRED